MGNNRLVFYIKGNTYRIVVSIQYQFGIVYIRFVGTHEEYDRIDAPQCSGRFEDMDTKTSSNVAHDFINGGPGAQELGDDIIREQVRLAMKQVPTMQTASFLVAIVLAYMVHDKVHLANIRAWIVAVLLIVTSRIVLHFQFSKVRDRLFAGQYWKKCYLYLALVSGVTWGMSAFLIFPSGSPGLISLFVLVMASLAAATTLSHSPIQLAPAAWAGPVMVSYALRCTMEGGETGYTISVLIVLYLITILRYSFIHHGTITTGIRMRFENLVLLKELRKAQEVLEAKVEERTFELSDANERLLQEMEERRQAEDALRVSEEKYRELVEQANSIVLRWDTKGVVSFVNEFAQRFFGYAEDELLGKSVMDTIVAKTSREGVDLEGMIQDICRDPLPFEHNENENVRKSGERVWVSWTNQPIFSKSGELVELLSIGQDMTERKRAQEALRASEKQYRSVIENIQDVFYRSDTKGRLLMGSPSGARLFGYDSVDEMIGLPLVSFWHDPAGQEQFIAQMRATGSIRDFEAVLKKRDGTTFNALLTTHFYYDDQEELLGTEGIIRDVTDRKRAEEEASRLRHYLENIINSMPSVLVGVDETGKVTQWNAAAERVTGIAAKAAQGHPLEQILPRLSHESGKIRQAIRDHAAMVDTKVPRVVNGQTRYEDVTIYPLAGSGVEGAVIRLDDVTERVRIEEMIVQSEKMLSVGGLAAGMAHEINNPLGAILQTLQNVLRRVSPDLAANIRTAEECGTTLGAVRQYLEQREVLSFLEDIRVSGQRAAQIVENMLTFSGKPDAKGSATSLSELLDRTLLLAESDYNLKKCYDFRQIEIVREYAPDVPLVVCQSGKVQQVFLNILRNGAEAMCEMKCLGRVPRFVLRVLAEGPYVRVEIEDNGPGMDEATRRRIFEPFFTSKPPGRGTGLGLFVSYFIITEDQGGTLTVESQPECGTRFVIRLPVGGRE